MVDISHPETVVEIVRKSSRLSAKSLGKHELVSIDNRGFPESC